MAQTGRGGMNGPFPRDDRRALLAAAPAAAQSDADYPNKPRLFDHLVGEDIKDWRNRDAQRVSGLAIDDQIKFPRLLDRKIGRFRTLEYFVHVVCGATIKLARASP
jgi:hypothetical protein